MGEIEHFVDPLNKDHHKFDSVKDMKLPLLSAQSQETNYEINNDVTVGEAVEKGIIGN